METAVLAGGFEMIRGTGKLTLFILWVILCLWVWIWGGDRGSERPWIYLLLSVAFTPLFGAFVMLLATRSRSVRFYNRIFWPIFLPLFIFLLALTSITYGYIKPIEIGLSGSFLIKYYIPILLDFISFEIAFAVAWGASYVYGRDRKYMSGNAPQKRSEGQAEESPK